MLSSQLPPQLGKVELRCDRLAQAPRARSWFVSRKSLLESVDLPHCRITPVETGNGATSANGQSRKALFSVGLTSSGSCLQMKLGISKRIA